jgi:amino acid transporter
VRRVIGIVLLVLALIGLVGVLRNFANGHQSRSAPLGSTAYERGRSAGQATAPIIVLVLAALGVWLVLGYSENRPPRIPGRAWYATPLAITCVAVGVGGILAVVAVVVIGASVRKRRQQTNTGTTYAVTGPNASQTRNQLSPVPSPSPFPAGTAVSAHWGGKWVPGIVTSVNGGGFSVMVQLDDPRFRQPIVLSTNQIRLR